MAKRDRDPAPDGTGRELHEDYGEEFDEERDLVGKEGPPSSRADVKFQSERTKFRWNMRFKDLSVNATSDTPTSSATEISGAILLIAAAGAVGAGVTTAAGILASAPGWITLILAAAIFGSVFVVGLHVINKRWH